MIFRILARFSPFGKRYGHPYGIFRLTGKSLNRIRERRKSRSMEEIPYRRTILSCQRGTESVMSFQGQPENAFGEDGGEGSPPSRESVSGFALQFQKVTSVYDRP